MVRALWIRIKRKSAIAIAGGVVTCASVAGGAIWRLSADRSQVGADLAEHGKRIGQVEEDLDGLAGRIGQLETVTGRIDSNVTWLREDAERREETRK